jgi:starch phosphorylase
MVAYFSMEIALHPAMPTYAGGLGVLAGDTLRSAADLGIPMVGMTLIHRHGYFSQALDGAGNQQEKPSAWNPDELLEPMKPVVDLTLDGRTVRVRAWRYLVQGASGSTVPVYLLDTMLGENTEEDRHLTDSLYGGDPCYRLCRANVKTVEM